MNHLFCKKSYFILLAISAFSFFSCNEDNEYPNNPIEKPYLIDITAEKHFSRADIITLINQAAPDLNILNSPLALMIKDVDVIAITYRTTGVNGKPTEASGVIALPSHTKNYKELLSIQHGTLDLEEAPSITLFNNEMLPVITGNIVIMADYLGYGKSQTRDRQHPYLHTVSTGVTCADMIEAAREYLKSKHIKEEDNKVKLMGYSQGGTSTIATVLELQRRGKTSIIKSVHAGGGAYDLEGILLSFTTMENLEYPRTGYLPYLIRGMEYGEQFLLKPSNIYAPAVISSELPHKLFTQKPLSQWHELLGTDISEVIHPDFYAYPNFNGNPDIIKLIAALRKNSLINCATPSIPITLYHSRKDDFIPFSNAEAAHEKWSNSTLIELTTFGHAQAAVEFMLRATGLWSFLN